MVQSVKRASRGPEVTARDCTVLEFMTEMYGARLDVLAVLLRRAGDGGAAPLSMTGVRQQVDRWRSAGWVRTEVALGHTWVTPTPKGMAVAQLGFPPWKLPVTKLAHTHAVNVVRLWYESSPARVDRQGPWVPERVLFSRRGRELWHVPDGALVDGQGRAWALEVELTSKHRPRYADEVFGRLHGAVVGVVYLVPERLVERVRSDVSAAVATTGRADLSVHVRVLPPVAGLRYDGQGLRS